MRLALCSPTPLTPPARLTAPRPPQRLAAPLALKVALKVTLALSLTCAAVGGALADTPPESPQGPEQVAAGEVRAPVPQRRGFWGTFFFWSGGVLVMYLVGRNMFREQANERRTLRRFGDELGHFFPEFDPPNLRRWADLAAPHLYAAWRAGEAEGLALVGTEELVEGQRAAMAALRASGRRRVCHLGKVLNIHPLGAYLVEGEETPPKGVELPMRVEVKVIDFIEGADGAVVEGERKQRQEQWLWTLRHTGASWRLHDARRLEHDVVDLAARPPLPPLMSWRRPEGVEVTTDLPAPVQGPSSSPPAPLPPAPEALAASELKGEPS